MAKMNRVVEYLHSRIRTETNELEQKQQQKLEIESLLSNSKARWEELRREYFDVWNVGLLIVEENLDPKGLINLSYDAASYRERIKDKKEAIDHLTKELAKTDDDIKNKKALIQEVGEILRKLEMMV